MASPPPVTEVTDADNAPVLPVNPNQTLTILVMPLRPEPSLVSPARALDELILTALTKLRHYQVLGPEDLNALVGADRLKDAFGCDDVNCAAELGGALNAQYLIAGRLTALGDEAVLSLRLMDTQAQRILARGTARGSLSADALSEMTVQALDDLLNMHIPQVKDVRQGSIAMDSSYEPVRVATPDSRQAMLNRQLQDIAAHLRRGQVGPDQALEMSAHACMAAAAYPQAGKILAELMQRSYNNEERWFAFAAQKVLVLTRTGQRDEARNLLFTARDRNIGLFRAHGMQEMLMRVGN